MSGLRMRLSHVKDRIEHQLVLKELIDTAVDRLIKVGYSNLNPPRVKARLASLRETWLQFSLGHRTLGLTITRFNSEEATSALHHSYFSEGLFSTTLEAYLVAVRQMSLLLEEDTETSHRLLSTPSTSQNYAAPSLLYHALLTPIDLPTFNGSPADWLSFKNLFISLIVDNPTLTLVEKLQYLKTSLTGSALLLLKNTTLIADNFQRAWDALIAVYENKRLVDAALQSLLSLKRITKESASELEQLNTNVMQIYRTLDTLNRPGQKWDDFLIFTAVQRLDAKSLKAWEHTLGLSKEPPTWVQLSEFLVTRMRLLKAFATSKISKRQHPNALKAHFQGKSKDQAGKKFSCSLCKANHYILLCPQYSSRTVQQRLAIINKHKLCFNCLGSHRASACKNTKRCQKYGHKHHTSIHQGKATASKPAAGKHEATKPESTKTETAVKDAKPPDANVLHSSSRVATSAVLLATAQIQLVNSHGDSVPARALVDQGSEITLITERLAQSLRLPRIKSSISLVGVGAQRSNKTKGQVSFKIKPHFPSNSEYFVSAHILPRLTGSLLSMQTETVTWPHLQDLRLADKDFTSPEHIDLILGADVYAQILENGVVKGDADAPIAQRTSLGWIISGPSGPASLSQDIHGFHVSLDHQLHELLQQFWNIEEIPSTVTSSLSPDESECEQHFVSTHTRDKQGRYTVRLPFKHPPDRLGDSKSKAIRIIHRLHRKLEHDSDYSKLYSDFMFNYEQLQHMTRVPESQPEPSLTYYLPHHGVMRENSSTTRLRVVFNGSSRTSSGHSLNDLLHTGAKLQVDLLNVLLWFRLFRYVFSSDMEKMFRQINIHESD
ncbi:PREDICTED: uncharacterized protein LOC105571095 [Vollenhovia emeryi]|uniref:uncharacterized protein LOC105571095 n=1 Tax=Vollenhovia emeryi TaxID=411798 RepID=UPI0005F47F55|nr:PREDICTED: uncharacterized protein LOC105571095 [Vollenhovia emeryi]